MLFTGIMLTASGPKVLEYNARFGDPETESVLLLLSEQTNLADIMMACTEGRLDQVEITVSPRYACNLIVAAGGYPEAYATGDLIEFGPTPDGIFFSPSFPNSIENESEAVRRHRLPRGNKASRWSDQYGRWTSPQRCCYRRDSARSCGEGVRRCPVRQVQGHVL